MSRVVVAPLRANWPKSIEQGVSSIPIRSVNPSGYFPPFLNRMAKLSSS